MLKPLLSRSDAPHTEHATPLTALFERRWPAVLGFAALAASVLCASGAQVTLARTSGRPMSWGSVLAWEGLSYGGWLPFAWAVNRVLRSSAPGGRLLLSLYLLSGVIALVHAAWVVFLDTNFRGVPASIGEWLSRLPIDLLMATAIAAFLGSARAYRLWREAQTRNRDLQYALDTAKAEARRARPAPPNLERLLVSVGAQRVAVEATEIEWFASAGNYLVANWQGREGLLRETLQALASRLDPSVFARAHRSTLVNLARVASAEALADGRWVVRMESGGELIVSRTYRDLLLQQLGLSR